MRTRTHIHINTDVYRTPSMNVSPLHTTPSQSNMTTSILSSREGSQGVGWDQVPSKLGAGEEEEEGGGGEVGVKGTLMQMHGVEKDAEEGRVLGNWWKALCYVSIFGASRF